MSWTEAVVEMEKIVELSKTETQDRLSGSSFIGRSCCFAKANMTGLPRLNVKNAFFEGMMGVCILLSEGIG
jgi:hypothetical protein